MTDLKSSLKDSILNISDLLEELLSSIDNSINDEEIKNASKKIILEINKELSTSLNNTVDKISEQNKEVNLIVNTTEGRQSILDSASIRRTALEEKIYCTTTIEGGKAVCSVIRNKDLWSVERLQDLHARLIK